MKKDIKKSSVSQRISLSLSLLLTFLMVSVGLISAATNQTSLKKETMDKGWLLIQSGDAAISTYLSLGRTEMLQGFIYKMQSLGDVRYISVINKEGTILAHTDNARIGKKITINSQSLTAKQVNPYRGDDGKMTGYDFTSPISDSGGMNTLGYLQIGLETAKYDGLLLGLIINLALTTIAAIIAGIMLSKILTRRLLNQPLRELKEATEYISSGDFTHQVPIRHMDELGVLATAFNSMNGCLGNLFLSVQTSANELNKTSENIVQKSQALYVDEEDKKQLETIKEIKLSAKKIHRMVDGLNSLSQQFKI